MPMEKSTVAGASLIPFLIRSASQKLLGPTPFGTLQKLLFLPNPNALPAESMKLPEVCGQVSAHAVTSTQETTT